MPVARVGIEQEDGKQRPIGQPTCADQIVHRAVAMRREASDEPDCADRSYGFRRGRRPPDALDERRERCRRDTIGGIVEAEVRGDGDRLDRMRLREVRRQRVPEGSLRRRMGTWRRAGGREEGRGSHPETGVVPGGVVSPVLAHRGLQHVLEAWCEQEGQPRRQGRGCLMRVADALVIGCALPADAHRMMAVLPKRCARYGVPMHPTKTALMACSTPETPQGSTEGNGPCACLGLPHDGTRSRRGDWGIKRRTAHKRRRRTKQARGRWGRPHRHTPRHYPDQQ